MNQIEQIKKELKRLASIKCRLKKQVGKASYADDMQKVVDQENKLKELKASLETDKKKVVTQYTLEDVQQLSYDEVLRAIKSIQSKKSNTRWLTPIEGDNEEYRTACRIEQMLKDRRAELVPTEVSLKLDIQNILNQSTNMSKDELVEAIQALL